MVVRLAKEDDLRGLERIERSSFRKERFPRALLAFLLCSNAFMTVVDETDGVLTGYASAYLDARESARLVSLAVLPAFRGRGVAKRLMEKVELGCIEKGVREISLEVSISNLIALHLYLRQGYEIAGIIKNYYGAGHDAFYMEKKIYKMENEEPPNPQGL
ncbi:MAG: GNAT family N-acetyltransferase [Methanomassiliicoccales archaeon]